MASAQQVDHVYRMLVDNPEMSKKLLNLMHRNFDAFTEPYNILPHPVSERLGGAHVSASWMMSNFMPFLVGFGTTAALLKINMSQESEEEKQKQVGNVQSVLTLISVSYALFTLGRMQYMIRVGIDRMFVTGAAFLEYVLAEGRVNLDNLRLLDKDVFARLPKRVQSRFITGQLRI